ncbi:MAG: hypothetical protein HQM03_17180 [Magnetococcales bacterium]|nr:hypothetical protein [Magnetococcales bacterium]
MFEFHEDNKSIVDSAKRVISEMFVWNTDQQEVKVSVAETAKYHKAVLTTVGQRKKPGSSLSVVLGQSGFITKDSLDACNTTKAFVRFVEDFLR